MQSFTVLFKDAAGLHTRPAAELVKLAKDYTSDILLCKGSKTAPASQLIKLMGLGIVQADSVTVMVEGDDELAAAAAVRSLLEAGHE